MKVLVQTKNGAKGVTDLAQPLFDGKRRVEVLDKDFKPTGDKLLCDPLSLRVIGYVD